MGAMKSSKDKKLWGHVTCVWYDLDAFFQDPARMAPIVFHRVKQQGKGSVCGICEKEGGFCVPCRWPECKGEVHARCAQQGGGGFLKMEAMFGGLLTEVYCQEHREKRLDPVALVGMVKGRVEGTGLEGAVVAMERRVRGESVRYASVDLFGKDLNPVIEMLGREGRSEEDRALADEVKFRLAALKKSLNEAKVGR